MATGFLHPGAMGASLATVCRGDRLWCGNGRSDATRTRAKAAGMEDVGSLEDLIARADVIVSACPPGAAVEVAEAVSRVGFDGTYVDANAIAPTTARSIAARFANFVDGGVVGPPVRAAGTTRLYLSGDLAHDVAALWKDTLLETRVVDGGAGAASAVKVCFAAWTKGTAALLLAIRALAAAENVEDALLAEWATSQPGLDDQAVRAATGNAPKAWRFAGELDEIATAFAAHDLPDGFATAASDVYQRLAQFKDVSDITLQDVISALRLPAGGPPPTARA
jgi:3-hydroxyisobutyrate dehydrogenase-like beta-hydroxyacid dehydrogenase